MGRLQAISFAKHKSPPSHHHLAHPCLHSEARNAAAAVGRAISPGLAGGDLALRHLLSPRCHRRVSVVVRVTQKARAWLKQLQETRGQGRKRARGGALGRKDQKASTTRILLNGRRSDSTTPSNSDSSETGRRGVAALRDSYY